jgi:hypothetical protein
MPELKTNPKAKAEPLASAYSKLASEMQRLAIPGLRLDLLMVSQPKDVEVFKTLPKLKSLAIVRAGKQPLLPDILQKLALNPNIERLHLSGRVEIGSDEWRALADFTNLSELTVPGDTLIDEPIARQLQALKKLRSLQFDASIGKAGNPVTGVYATPKASVRSLTGVKQLEHLALAGETINAEAIPPTDGPAQPQVPASGRGQLGCGVRRRVGQAAQTGAAGGDRLQSANLESDRNAAALIHAVASSWATSG